MIGTHPSYFFLKTCVNGLPFTFQLCPNSCAHYAFVQVLKAKVARKQTIAVAFCLRKPLVSL